jgi:hypothetical protein
MTGMTQDEARIAAWVRLKESMTEVAVVVGNMTAEADNCALSYEAGQAVGHLLKVIDQGIDAAKAGRAPCCALLLDSDEVGAVHYSASSTTSHLRGESRYIDAAQRVIGRLAPYTWRGDKGVTQ